AAPAQGICYMIGFLPSMCESGPKLPGQVNYMLKREATLWALDSFEGPEDNIQGVPLHSEVAPGVPVFTEFVQAFSKGDSPCHCGVVTPMYPKCDKECFLDCL
ncbi:hypothetical protein AMTR_s00059p00140980, partial [Amborella trichopoda]